MSKKGFTLIEAILYLAIAGTVLYFISGFAFNAIFGKAKIESIQELNQSSRLVLDQMSNAINNALEINGMESVDLLEEEEFVSQIPTDGLVAYWSFDDAPDGTALDSAGDNDGTVIGATATSGVRGGAYSFDGVNDCITVPSSDSFYSSDAITFSIWAKTDDVNREGYHLSAWDGASRWSSCIYGGKVCSLYKSLTSSNHTSRSSNNNVLNNNWFNFTTVMNGPNSEISIYVNGVLDQGVLSNNGAGWSTNKPPIRIGTLNYTSNAYGFFRGQIDQVRIYNRALTAEEIAAIYNEEKP